MYTLMFNGKPVEFEDVVRNGPTLEHGGSVMTAWYKDSDELLSEEELEAFNDALASELMDLLTIDYEDNYGGNLNYDEYW